jgi:hypothetical protein
VRPSRTEWRGWDSNPRSRAHEAREDSRSSTALSGRQESNLRSPVPKTGGVAISPTTRRRDSPWDMSFVHTLGGSRTRVSGLRARRHSVRLRGRESSGGRDRTCTSRVTAARLSRSTTPECDGGSRTRTCERLHVYALAPRRLADSAIPPREGRGGSRTPKARRPTRFRDGVPHQWQPFQTMAPAGLEPARPRVRAGSSAELSYGAVSVTGRDRTCDAPRFRRALYRTELRSRESGRSRIRTGDLLRIREALCQLSYPPMGEAGLDPAASCL